MLASAVHNVAKYYQRPKRSSNKIRILQSSNFEKKNEFNIPTQGCIKQVMQFRANLPGVRTHSYARPTLDWTVTYNPEYAM